MSISQYEKDGRTLFMVREKVRDSSGKQITRKKMGITSEAKALKIQNQLRREVEAKVGGFSGVWTWESWRKECLNRMRFSHKQSTLQGYDGELVKWLPKEWENLDLSTITKNDVYEVIFERMVEKGATPNARRNVHKKIRRILEMAVEEGVLSRNPARGFSVKIPDPEKKVLNAIEAELLLEKAREYNHRFYPVWAFGLFSGMRSGEMYALTWKDIDFETALIKVNKQWTSKDGLHETKGNRNRVVPISSELKGLLLELRRNGSFSEKVTATIKQEIDGVKQKQEISYTLEDLVLPRLEEWQHGEQASVLREFCHSIEITEIKFHDLRATFITNMLAQGVPLPQVMAIVGHRKTSTTDEYLRLAGVNIKGATEKLGYKLPRLEEGGKVVRLFKSQD